MITVHRINDRPIVINAELIRSVEETPDTTIRLTNGDHLIVKESMREVVALTIEYGRSLRRLLPVS